MLKHLAVLAALLTLFCGVTLAQPLADRVPADAAVYVGWRGIDAVHAQYDASHLKGVLEATQISRRVRDAVRAFAQFAPAPGMAPGAAPDPEFDKAMKLFDEAGADLWQYPWAFYLAFPHPGDKFLPADADEEDNDQDNSPYGVLLCQAKGDAPAVLKRLQALMPVSPDEPAPSVPSLTQEGDLVVLHLWRRRAPGANPGAGAGAGATLATAPAFTHALSQVKGEPAAILFVNGTAILDSVDHEMAAGNDHEAADQWDAMREALGLRGLHALLWTGTFAGKDWATSLLIDAPAPRRGIVKLLERPAVTPEALKLVPKTALWCSATQLDLGAILDTVRAALGKGEPRAQAAMDQGLSAAAEGLGFNVEIDLIKGLGSEWVFYADDALADPPGAHNNAVGINVLREPGHVESALVSLTAMAKAMIPAPPNGGDPPVQFEDAQVNGIGVHEIQFKPPAQPPMTIAWAIHDRRLVIGQSSGGVATVAKAPPPEGQTILDNPAYLAMRQRLAGGQAVQLHFTDLARTAPGVHAGAQTLLRMAGAVALMRAPAPAPAPGRGPGNAGPANAMEDLLPPLADILPQLAPAGSVGWTDDAGYHAAGLMPFPGSNLLDPPALASPLVAALASGTLLPAMGGSRKTANQMNSSSRLRGIHQGMVIWAQSAPGNHLPPDIGTLIEGSFIAPPLAISPLDTKKAPSDLGTWPVAKQKDWVNANTSYAYVTGLTDDADGKKIALFEKLHRGTRQTGIGIVYNDNHVTFTPLAEARKLILQQTHKTLEEWSGLPARKAETQPAR